MRFIVFSIRCTSRLYKATHTTALPLSTLVVSGASRRATSSRRVACYSVVTGLQRRIAACNDGASLVPSARPLLVGDGAPLPPDRERASALGLVLPEAAAQLARFPDVFHVSDDAVRIVGGDSVDSRSKAVAQVLQQLREDGSVPMLRGWRDELWPAKTSFHAPVELVVERAAGPLLGVRGFGCHINGLVERVGAKLDPAMWALWVARRSRSKPTYPGKLDHLVAGGLSHGEAPGDNVIKECAEEAGIPEEIACLAQPVGIVEYCQMDETGWGIKRDALFCYDLVMPSDFQPAPCDGEVESFDLWEMPTVLESLAGDNDEWKPNVALVIIDMLVRRGVLVPEEPGYVELVRSLRQ